MPPTNKHTEALAAHPRRRDYRTFAEFKSEFDGSTQMASYLYNESPIDLLYAPRAGSKRLAVFFNSQQKSGELRLFTWQKVSRSFAANRLFIADPSVSMNDSLNLAWYIGNKNANTQQHIESLIRHIANLADVDELIFFGSSGGGYPAIYYSQIFDNSVAVTLAPTTTVFNHTNRALVNSWVHNAYGESVHSIENLPTELVLDLPSAYSGGLANPVIILQNADDDFIFTQTSPLAASQGMELDELDSAKGKLFVRIESYGSGHMPPPAEHIAKFAAAISNIPDGDLSRFDYSTLLEETKLDL